MLKIHFGKVEGAFYGPSWFWANYEIRWFEDPLVCNMLNAVDKSEYVGGYLIQSEILGPISPKDLSGGVKTLISILKRPDLVFDATSCGPNCAKWLLEIGKQEDVLIMLEYFMPFDGYAPFEVYIENLDKTFQDENEYAYAALDLLHVEAE